MRTIFRGKVKRGQLTMSAEWFEAIRALEGCEIEATLEKHRSTRSVRQNAYYFSVVVKMISEETGYSKDETHEILRGKFLSEEVKVGNEVIRYAKSTTALNTAEFETLMTEIREWASVTLNLLVPQPNEVLY